MKKFLRAYVNRNEKNINYGLINKEYDTDLVYYIVDCCKSLESLPNIKFLGYDYITNEADIDVSQYISEKSRESSTTRGSKDKRKITRHRYIDDSRNAELRLRFLLTCNGESEEITKKILIPIKDDNNYYLIKGTKYILMYQIVDSSTYTTKKSLPLKSMMPVSLQVDTSEYTDTDKETHQAPVYSILLFKKKMNIILFYLANMGLDMTLKYFSAYDIIRFTEKDKHTEDTICFSISSKMYLEVNKKFFYKYQYTRTIVFMLLDAMTNRMTFENLNNPDHWVEVIGSIGTTNKINQIEKGINTITFFNRLLDDTTKRLLKLHPMHKQSIYSILRWMIMHFDDLRKKDNMDLKNKRLRCNEYIAAMLTRVLGERVNRIISLGSKATLKDIKEIFKFPGDIIITQLHKSGLLRFDDRINDMDFFAKLKITMKGPNAMGGTSGETISAQFRDIDPSYLGRIDLNVCGKQIATDSLIAGTNSLGYNY